MAEYNLTQRERQILVRMLDLSRHSKEQFEAYMKYLADNCDDGRYGSTQSTVLALRAIVAYDKARARPKAPGSLRLYVDGQPVGGAVAFDAKTEGAIKLPDAAGKLGPGDHKLELRMQGGSAMPYAVSVDYNALTPASSAESPLGLEVKLASEKYIAVPKLLNAAQS